MAYTPINLGPTTTANSQAVVLPSDQVAIPVTGPLTDTQIRATALPVSGTVTANAGTGTQNVSVQNASLAVTGSFYQATQPVSGTFYQVTQPVSGTFWQATQPVSIAASVAVTGPLTDTQLRATAVPVSGTFYQATQPVTVVSGATGGDTTFHLVSAATTNLTNIKASAGKVTGWYIYNSNASARKVAFHNTAGTPTAGSGVVSAIIIPGLAAANVSFPDGIDFATGIAISTVTDLTDAGTTAVGLNDLIINIYYK